MQRTESLLWQGLKADYFIRDNREVATMLGVGVHLCIHNTLDGEAGR